MKRIIKTIALLLVGYTIFFGSAVFAGESGLKQYAIKYVPGYKKARDYKKDIQSIKEINARVELMEKLLLPGMTADLLRQLTPHHSKSISWVRIGRDTDGGYVMGDIFDKVDAAYSFGIANDVSWDKDIANRSIPVYMYDHTIDSLPEQHENFRFFKVGICGKPNQKGMKDIGRLIEENGHKGKNLILKMDIEGYEYPALEAITDEELSHFSQIVCEFHDMDGLLKDISSHDQISSCFKKILKHMHCVHIHANNVGKITEIGNVKIPALLEITFIRKDMANDFEPTDLLRTDLDRNNNVSAPAVSVAGLWKQKAI